MTSSTDDVTVTSLQDGGDAETMLPSDNCQSQQQNGQGHCVGQGQSQDEGERDQLASVVKTKPQKPVKPKNLLSLMKSHDTNGNCVTAVESGSSSRSPGSSDVVDVSCLSQHSSDVNDSSEQVRDGVDTTSGQNSLPSNVKQPDGWTTSFTESDKQSSTISLTSPQPNVCVETTAGQISLRNNCEHMAHGTPTSPQFSFSTSFAKPSYPNSEVGEKTSRRQVSARSGDEQRTEWTKESTESFQQFSDDHRLSQPPSVYRQINPRSDDNQSTVWTAESTQQIQQSSSDSLSSEHLADGDEISCRQNSRRCLDNQLGQWTTSSTSQSSRADLLPPPSETTCGQTRPSCDDELQTTWTQASREVQEVSFDEDEIEPPIINDLLPANVHIRRGESLRLVAQFTASPAPDVCWYRANDLINPGHYTSIITIIRRNRSCSGSDLACSYTFLCLSVCRLSVAFVSPA